MSADCTETSICFNVAPTTSQKIIHLTEALVLHHRLVAILFILGVSTIRRAVATRDDNHISAPACWLRSHCFGHRVLPGKLNECDGIVVGRCM